MRQRRRIQRTGAALLGAALVVTMLPALAAPATALPPAAPLAVGAVADLPAGVRDGDRRLGRDALRADLAGQRFYFLLPDRFANGDPRNDTAGSPGGRSKHGFDPADKGYYHGGDLAGLRSKLDYLRGMGTTAVWLTPMFRNRWVQGSGSTASAGYHGYWTTDYTALDPHFGTVQEMRALIKDAHGRGMKVFFDIVANHTADVIDYAGGKHDYRGSGAQPYLDADGRPIDLAALAGGKDFPKLDARRSFAYEPVLRAGDAEAKKPRWLNDVTLYHNRGNSTFAGESSTHGDFDGLDDLMTEHPRVVDGMTGIFTSWIDELDIDGYRVDTVKHVNLEFWRALAPRVQEHARRKGKKDFFVFGEVYDGDPAITSKYTTGGRLQSVLDFPFQGGARAFAAGQGADRLAEVLLADDRYTDADSNANALPTFLGNHDMGRIATMLRQDRPGMSEAETLARLRLAHSLMYFWRGNPVVYYGDEQGFVGTGGDKDARQDMFPSKVPEWLEQDQIGTDATPAADNFDPKHPLYRHLGQLSSFVDGDPVWRRGNQVLRLAERDVLAFSRIDRDTQVEHVVLANGGNTPAEARVPVSAPGLGFRTVWGGDAALTSGVDGTVRVSVPPLSAVVLRSTGRIPVPGSGSGQPTLVVPPVGTGLGDRVELRADHVTAPFAQATFAARVAGERDWTVLGTDDAAPYRVYADLAALPGAKAGARVELRTVVKDAAGRLTADGAEVALVAAPGGGTGAQPSPDWLVVHYNRPTGDYDGWGLHVWGEVAEPTAWERPLPFAGETGYGRFAWVKLKPGAKQVGFLVHKGEEKDVAGDRFVDPSITPQVWLKQGQAPVFPSQSAATGAVEIRYHRPGGDYGGVRLRVGGGIAVDQPAELPLEARDDYGVRASVRVNGTGAPVELTVLKDGATDVIGRIEPVRGAEAWLRQGDQAVHTSRAAAERRIVLHYHRPAGDYADWTLYHWGGSATPSPSWNESQRPDRQDGFGLTWSVPLAEGATGLSYLLHRGDTKDPGPDQRIQLGATGHEVWYASGATRPDGSVSYVLPPSVAAPADADLSKAKAIWVSKDRVVWDVPASDSDGYELRHDPDGRIAVVAGQVQGGRVLRLAPDPGGLPAELAAKFPHLRGKPVYRLRASDVDSGRDAVRGQVVAVHRDAGGALRHATGVQLAGVLDAHYAPAAAGLTLGPLAQPAGVRLWAPTAKSVNLRLFERTPPDATTAPSQTLALQRDPASGAWSGFGDWLGRYYQFEVTAWQPRTGKVETAVVTDPYSLALTVDSTHSQLTDLREAPPGWDREVAKGLGPNPARHAITELHVRDFSIGDTSVPESDRGTYKAFTHRDSTGMRHLRALAEAGMDTVHLLPTFDIATIPERRADQQRPACDLAGMPADSEQQQECVTRAAAKDGFNWGYDPWHYDVPEGSYATPDAQSGQARARQYREMVQALHANGNRVVVDVVYNHTAAAGNDPRSVLDRVVPGYYQRLTEDGSVANSTCCANTATENAMMGKLVVDSVLRWARLYKVDGFRFDLMGHHPKANILAVRAALDGLTVARDGVDGRNIRLYGEGWDFGEVGGNARFEQATQANMAGTGVGTFNDRLRDGVRGGGPFDADPRVQGLGSGLAGAPNGSPANGTPAEQLARLTNYTDLVKLGLAGNAADFRFRATNGTEIIGRDVRYNGARAGYTAAPAESITYVDAHDNESLYDALAYKLPPGTPMADRIRMHTLALAPALLGQGQPLVHAGTEFLRSKSLDRNSYDSGDWFNRYDPSLRTSAFGAGLPPAHDNRDKWPYAKPLLANPTLKPTPTDLRTTLDRTLDLLRLRQSSPLFTLPNQPLVQQKLTFPDPGPQAAPGTVLAHLDDTAGPDVDPARRGVLVVINPDPGVREVVLPAGGGWRLHELQAGGGDPVVRETGVTGDRARVPGRTVAVLVR
ncbi:pullulanase-type alpha-1,6-glucosidase [Crossiella cryophila]|uniref:alpha-amylase n=1 Tax=Crossiella cryophila TaxID=43355 RepID=A0A7W7FSL6_9PSEU|nr:pullulanase-type alpha-1,6-glucosidase [Crossiella cryophila]MBB4676312.1 pullulanase-type alpha-1,6-glucosidase [Crossiella cryophila]